MEEHARQHIRPRKTRRHDAVTGDKLMKTGVAEPKLDEKRDRGERDEADSDVRRRPRRYNVADWEHSTEYKRIRDPHRLASRVRRAKFARGPFRDDDVMRESRSGVQHARSRTIHGYNG